MAKRIIIIIVILIGIGLIILMVLFYRKNYVEYELMYVIPDVETSFRPLAYEFFHTENEMKNYFKRNKNTKKYKEHINNWNVGQLDFDNYSYCVVYGRKVESMYYSWKERLFSDFSPSYAKSQGSIFVTIEYGINNDSLVYLYRVLKNNKFRGVDGL